MVEAISTRSRGDLDSALPLRRDDSAVEESITDSRIDNDGALLVGTLDTGGPIFEGKTCWLDNCNVSSIISQHFWLNYCLSIIFN